MVNKRSILLVLGSAYLVVVAGVCIYKTQTQNPNVNQPVVITTTIEQETSEASKEQPKKAVEAPKVVKANTAVKTKKIPATTYVVRGKRYTTLSSDSAKNLTQIGTASWYGPGFHGKKTANGEIYNQNAMTAAHKTLPLSTKIKVTNLENNKTVYLRVNDRGPYHGNRILDLSKRAAQELGVLGKGTAKIKLQVIN